jgi:hypothetical protein
MLGVTHAISKGPWTKPLNWNLQANLYGEPCIPFALYVQQEPTHPLYPAFPQFHALPAELQLRILRFCDSPTLFQLMQASSAMRIEAKKLFWSCPGTWYRVEADWLLAGGFPGHAHHAINILPYVEQVEVNFDHMDSLCQDWEVEISRGRTEESAVPLQSVEDRVRGFWKTLQYRLPRATDVVVTESTPRRATESLPDDLKIITEMCPKGIRASASFLKRTAGYTYLLERSLWRQAERDVKIARQWQQITSTWTRQSILLPPKEFRGPVGAYDSTFYKFHQYCRQKTGAQLLVIEAMERHHFHERRKPFDCLEPGCEARFGGPGEWTLHAIDNAHFQSAVVPDNVKALFDQNNSLLEQTYKQDKTWGKIKAAWGKEGSEKRRIAEQAFLHQLDHDPLHAHGKPARECSTWLSYTLDLDPTYVYR